jgi:hypothetical protein
MSTSPQAGGFFALVHDELRLTATVPLAPICGSVPVMIVLSEPSE